MMDLTETETGRGGVTEKETKRGTGTGIGIMIETVTGAGTATGTAEIDVVIVIAGIGAAIVIAGTEILIGPVGGMTMKGMAAGTMIGTGILVLAGAEAGAEAGAGVCKTTADIQIASPAHLKMQAKRGQLLFQAILQSSRICMVMELLIMTVQIGFGRIQTLKRFSDWELLLGNRIHSIIPRVLNKVKAFNVKPH